MTEGLRQTSSRLYMLATRGTLPSAPDDTQTFQEMTVSGLAGETHTAVEHPTSYGFSHVPVAPTGQQTAEIFTVYLGAHRSNPVAMLVGDRRYRLGKMAEGDIAHHTRSTMQSHFVDGKGHVRSGPNSHYHRHQIMQSGDAVLGGLNPIAPFASGQTPWAGKTPHSYRHHDTNVKQDQHPGTINHHIISGPAVPPNLQSAVAGLSGIMGQIGSLAGQAAILGSAGVGLPAINSIGSQITALTSTVTGAGVTPAMTAILGAVTAGATTLSSAGSTTGAAALATSVQGLATRVQALMGGGMSQIIHSHMLDKAKGILHSAFQGQHTIAITNNPGIAFTSSVKVSSSAPNIPHNGQVQNSDSTYTTGDDYAAAFPTISDGRLKSDIADHTPVLEKLMGLRVKTFAMKKVHYGDNGFQKPHGDKPHRSFGLVAQEVAETFPLLVHGNVAKGYLGVNESKIGVLVLHALQEFVVETREAIEDLKHAHYVRGR